jgi:CBS domain containing-hemolysin-like protein
VLERFGVIVLLLLLNGYFVAVEFALVRSRRTRLQAMVRSGDRIARFALHASGNLEKVLSASQLGITLASLGLGWAAEGALAHSFESLLASLPFALEQSLRVSAGAISALLAVTFCHVVFGELAPRAAALHQPEVFAKWLSPPLLVFAWFVRPFTAVLNLSARGVLRLFGQRAQVGHDAVHSPDELRMLVEQSEEQGAIDSDDAQLIGGVFEFSEKNAREVMTPRTAIVALTVDAALDDAARTVEEAGFSRYPVYDDTIDNVVGMLHAKDLLPILRDPTRAEDFAVRQIMRRIHVVPGSREVEEVLGDFKRLKEHMAIVLDEYGGTAGLVTMEDLLEEIVGEILDEYDETTDAKLPATASGELQVQGSTPIREFNLRWELSVPDTDYTTVGGFVFGALGRLPIVGDRVVGGGASFVVRSMIGRRVGLLVVQKDTASV